MIRLLFITTALGILSGCATSQQSAANPVGTVIIAANTIKNAQQLTREGVRAELKQEGVNLLRKYNRSQGGF